MKRLLLLAVAVSVLSCTGNPKDKKARLLAMNTSEKTVSSEIYGYWYGQIGGDRDPKTEIPLKVHIRQINKNIVYGTTEINGNTRYFSGKLTQTDGATGIHFTSGGDTASKVFDLRYENGDLRGTLHEKGQPESVRSSVLLRKREFRYDAAASTDSVTYIDYDHPAKKSRKVYTRSRFPVSTAAVFGLNASASQLTESQLKNLKKADLELLRNSIYARHGYIFQTPSWMKYFAEFEWYVPVAAKVDDQLTAVEKNNIKLLERFEKYADEYYEYFGR